MAGKHDLRKREKEDKKRKIEYEDNLRIRTITDSTYYDENPDAEFSPPHMRIWEVLEHWKVTGEAGLAEREIRRRRRRFGTNVIYPYLQLSFAGSLRSQLHTSMSLLFLAVCLLLYIFEKNTIFLAAVIVNVVFFVINAIIEARAASALEETRKQSTMKCVVRRDGNERIVDSRAIVPGDIIILGAGNIVPADARLIESNTLRVSETPVFGNYNISEKNALYISGRRDTGSMPNMVYAGSIITEGKAEAVVCATDKDLMLRQRRDAANKGESLKPTLLQYVHAATSKLSLASVVICIIAIFLGAIKSFELSNIFVLAVGSCFVSLTDTVNSLASAALTMGIRNIDDRGATLRNLNCIPELCTINTIMCEYSTAFPVRGIAATSAFTGMREYNIEASSRARIQELITDALVCSDVKYAYSSRRKDEKKGRLIGSKPDVAIARAAISLGISIDEIHENYFRIASSYNYQSELERVLVLKGSYRKVILKGTPEFVLKHCKYYQQLGQQYPLDEKSKNRLLDAAYEMGEKNQRVFAYAEKFTDEDNLRHSDTTKDFVFVGFMGLYVSLGMDAASAVFKCSNAGIETVVRTNEPYHIAVSMAKNAGIIKDESEVMVGSHIDKIDAGIYIADLPKYKLFVDIDEDRWTEIIYFRKKENAKIALQASSLAELYGMSMADITIASESGGNETLKQCSDVIIQKEGFDVITKLLIKARMIYKRIHSTVRFGIVPFTAFFTALILSFFFGVEPAFRLNEILVAGVVINFLILFALSSAPEEAGILKHRPIRPYTTEFRYSDLFLPILYGLISGVGMVVNYRIGMIFNGGYTSVLVGILLSMFFFAYSDDGGTGKLFSGGYKNYYLTIALFISIGITAFLIYSETGRNFFSYSIFSVEQILYSMIFPVALFLLQTVINIIIRKVKYQTS